MSQPSIRRGRPDEVVVSDLPRISDLDRADPRCPVCSGCGWVCEEHPHRPWGGLSTRADACECGAGQPCTCNPLSGEPV